MNEPPLSSSAQAGKCDRDLMLYRPLPEPGRSGMRARCGNVAPCSKTSDSAAMAPRYSTLPPRRLAWCGRVGLALSVACTVFAPPTRVTVLHTTSADRALRESGESLNVDHVELVAPPSGPEKGFFVVKSDLEWHQHWPDVETDKVPVLPHDFDFAKDMLLVVAPPDRDVVATTVRTVVSNEGGIHAYVEETLPGVDCPPRDKESKPTYDLARLPLVEGKDVTFHVDSVPGDACGTAPDAKVTCRGDKGAGNAATAFEEKLSTPPGVKISCIVGQFTSPRPIIDLTWTFTTLPLGATSKMVVGSRGTGVSFTPDVFGVYGLQVEVLDDLQRRGTAAAEVDVSPRAPLELQLLWTQFDPNDDPSTFPRIELAVQRVFSPAIIAPPPVASGSAKPASSLVAPPAGPPMPGMKGAPPVVWRGAEACSLSSAQTYCKPEVVGFTTVMSIDESMAKLYGVGVHFTDDRVNGQAVPCVRSYRMGKLVADLCDSTPHKADDWWSVAVIDSDSGKTTETLAAEKAQAAIKAAAAAKAAAEEKALSAAKAAAEAKAAAAAKPAGSASSSAKPASSAPPPASAKPASSSAPGPSASAAPKP
jgi:hypothetical protein